MSATVTSLSARREQSLLQHAFNKHIAGQDATSLIQAWYDHASKDISSLTEDQVTLLTRMAVTPTTTQVKTNNVTKTMPSMAMVVFSAPQLLTDVHIDMFLRAENPQVLQRFLLMIEMGLSAQDLHLHLLRFMTEERLTRIHKAACQFSAASLPSVVPRAEAYRFEEKMQEVGFDLLGRVYGLVPGVRATLDRLVNS